MKAIIIIILVVLLIILNMFFSSGVAGFPLPVMELGAEGIDTKIFPLATLIDLAFAILVVVVSLKLYNKMNIK